MDIQNKLEKYALIEAALLANPHFADRRIAAGLPVHYQTVSRVRDYMVAANKIPKQERLLGIDDKWRSVISANGESVGEFSPPDGRLSSPTSEAIPEIVDVLLELVKYALPYRSDLVDRLRKLRG